MVTTEDMLTLDEVASDLNITPRTLRTYLLQNKIRGHKIGRKVYFTHTQVEEYIASTIYPKEVRSKNGNSKKHTK